MTGEDSPEFKAHVLEWLRREQGIDAASVESVRGGSSCEWITSNAAVDTFGVDVGYTMRDGLTRVMDVQADAMASLWRWVVGGSRA